VAYLTWNQANEPAPLDGSLRHLIKPCAHIPVLCTSTQENGPYIGGSNCSCLSQVQHTLHDPKHYDAAQTPNLPVRQFKSTSVVAAATQRIAARRRVSELPSRMQSIYAEDHKMSNERACGRKERRSSFTASTCTHVKNRVRDQRHIVEP
jgi:hypothetical protein